MPLDPHGWILIFDSSRKIASDGAGSEGKINPFLELVPAQIPLFMSLFTWAVQCVQWRRNRGKDVNSFLDLLQF